MRAAPCRPPERAVQSPCSISSRSPIGAAALRSLVARTGGGFVRRFRTAARSCAHRSGLAPSRCARAAAPAPRLELSETCSSSPRKGSTHSMISSRASALRARSAPSTPRLHGTLLTGDDAGHPRAYAPVPVASDASSDMLWWPATRWLAGTRRHPDSRSAAPQAGARAVLGYYGVATQRLGTRLPVRRSSPQPHRRFGGTREQRRVATIDTGASWCTRSVARAT
jgi:hypothetical protein